ncbi:peptide deformylase, partial [Thermodesulfobacteriota bacterium]
MAILEILTYPNKFLKQPTEPIENIDGETQKTVEEMTETMYAASGIGLAAIQVGYGRSLLIYDVAPRDEKRSLHVLINPRIISSEGETLSEEEGCLSIPEYRADV